MKMRHCLKIASKPLVPRSKLFSFGGRTLLELRKGHMAKNILFGASPSGVIAGSGCWQWLKSVAVPCLSLSSVKWEKSIAPGWER